MSTLDCLSCGACCTSKAYGGDERYTFVPVSDPEARRLERRYGGRILEISKDFYDNFELAVSKGQCLALKGEPGRRVTCAIYEDRPSACRDFRVGSQVCLEARAAAFPETAVVPTAQAG